MFGLKNLKKFKDKLTRIGTKDPLNFFSIVLILGLDLFVLFQIFGGLGLQTEQLASPWEKIPYQCKNLIEANTSDLTKQETIFQILRGDTNYYAQNEYRSAEELINAKAKEQIDPLCREIFDVALKIGDNESLAMQLNEISKLETKKMELENEIAKYQGNYDTMLLEEIADQPPTNSIIEGKPETVKPTIKELKDEVSTLNLRIENLTAIILSDTEVKSFFDIVAKNKEAIVAKEKSLNFWYSLQKVGIELLFLLPLLLIFIYFYLRNLRKNNELLIFIFAHLLVVTAIPVFVKIIELFVEILPFHLLADFVALLQALHLVIILNYFLIFLGIVVVIGLIYLIQKKFFSRQRLNLKRIADNKCWACGAKLPQGLTHCYNCGENQMQACPSCKKSTYKTGLHCTNCGTSLNQVED